jgi:hypothetical protein
MAITTPIHVFDCRLKEDYGSLPSYFETGLVKPQFTTIMPSTITSPTTSKKGRNENDNSLQQHTNEDEQPHHYHAYLCECYAEFCQLMGSKSTYTPDDHHAPTTLDRIPSRPPPEYCVD